MKKKADIFLPKGKEAKNVEFKLVDGKIEVSYDVEDIFNPKDGDFLATKDGRVFIYNGRNTVVQYGAYCGIDIYNKIILLNYFSCGWTGKEGCRYATEQEKSAFLERLEKECKKKWNAEKKCLEDVYMPKFGDIVKVETKDIGFDRSYMICIYPNKVFCKSNDFFNLPFINLGRRLTLDMSGGSFNIIRLTPASESEKQELFNKLAEVGKRWNPETKQIEDIRWTPKDDEIYYYVESWGDIGCSRKQPIIDEIRIVINNCFKTEEAAQKVANSIKEIFKNSKAE